MKLNNRWITIFIVIIIGLIGCNIYLAMQNKNIHTNKDNNKISKKSEEEKYYDCSFTRTYRVVDLLDGYIAEVPELSYVVLDAYQSHGAFTHIIPTTTKKGLKENKYYEFTYTIKGTGIINDENDVRSYIGSTEINQNNIEDSKLKVTLEIKETDKLGMEQVQENICEGK